MAVVRATSQTVLARDAFGRFKADLDNAARETVQDMVQDGAKLARHLAPRGKKRDPRYARRLHQSIHPTMLDSRSGLWGSDQAYALAREYGGTWKITGNLNFYWDRESRMFTSPPYHNSQARTSTITHSSSGTHYLLRSYETIMGRWMEYARRNYPN